MKKVWHQPTVKELDVRMTMYLDTDFSSSSQKPGMFDIYSENVEKMPSWANGKGPDGVRN